MILALVVLTSACTAEWPAAAPPAQRSILTSSWPRDGATVRGEVDELRLHFDPPARLDEVKVVGPDGVMPTMVDAAGELSNYSLPLSGLAPGVYSVDWRATARGREYRGAFSFTVK